MQEGQVVLEDKSVPISEILWLQCTVRALTATNRQGP